MSYKDNNRYERNAVSEATSAVKNGAFQKEVQEAKVLVKYFNEAHEGLVDGALHIENEYFTDFLKAFYESGNTKRKINCLKKEIEDAEAALQKKSEQYVELQGAQVYLDSSIDQLEAALQELKEEKQKRSFKRKKEREEKEQIRPEYGKLPTFLFLITGIAFVGADLVITHDIFWDFLNMQNRNAWVLASSLALIAFGIKFVFDRFVERPFRKGNEKAAKWIGIAVVFLAMIMMGLVGYFRIATLDKELHLDYLNSQITKSNEYFGNEPSSTAEESMTLEEKRFDVEREIVRSRSIIVVFVLSSLLFLVVGAFCFSIGFYNLRQHRERDKGLEELEKRVERESKNWEDTFQEKVLQLRKERGAVVITQTRLELLPAEIEELKTTVVQKKEALESSYEKLYRLDYQMKHALYRLAFLRGKQYLVNGKPYINVNRLMSLVFKLNGAYIKQRTEGPKVPRSPEEPWLHRRIRKEILRNAL